MRKPSVREQKPKVSELAVCNKTLASPTWASGLHLCIRGFDVSRSVHTASQGIPCDSQRFIVSQFLAELAIPKERTSGDRGLRACKSQSSQSSFATASNPESKRWRVGEVTLDNFFSFRLAPRGAPTRLKIMLIAHRRPYAIDETVPSSKNGFQHRRRRPRPQVDELHAPARAIDLGPSRRHLVRRRVLKFDSRE